MLYLIEDRDYVKIGYSKNVDERLKQYRTCNCYAKLLDVKPGTIKDEKVLHKICEPHQYSSEGFHNVPEVKQAFLNYKSEFVDFEGLKNLVNSRYEEFRKTGTFPYLTIKDELEIRRHNIAISEFPEVKIWIHYINDQIKLDEILKFLKTGNQCPLNVNKLTYDIHPDDCYNINKDIFELPDVLSKELEKYQTGIQEFHELKPFYTDTLEQNNRYFNLKWMINDFDSTSIKNRVNFYKEIITKFSSED